MAFIMYLNKTIHRTVLKGGLFKRFGLFLNKMVYAGAWKAKNINQSKKRIMKKLNELDIKVVQSMFLDTGKQLRKIADKRPYEACSF